MSGDSIDAGNVDYRTVNRLTGPIFIEDVYPGDAVGFEILRIEVGPVVHVPFIARWRWRYFPQSRSSVERYSISGNIAHAAPGIGIELRPMIGAIAVAPESGQLSFLSPTGRTGGNLDLPQVRPGAVVWLPVEVVGGLFAVGDLHASMGQGEPLGAGLECAGSVTGRFHCRRGFPLSAIRIEHPDDVRFLGSHAHDHDRAIQQAISAAWRWLSEECGLDSQACRLICAAELDLIPGGPAGANHVASLDVSRLRREGFDVSLLRERTSPPMAGRRN
jgi:acetamidase/formamidase